MPRLNELFRSPASRDAARRLLLGARRRIDCGSEDFVCAALQYGRVWSDWAERDVLCHEIMKRLAPASTVVRWLERQGILVYAVQQQGLSPRAVKRAYRLRWIDSMIEELK